MRMSILKVETARDDPTGAEVASHRLLLRAGYVRQEASGVFAWLPLGVGVHAQVESIVREELARTRYGESVQVSRAAREADAPRARGGLLAPRESTLIRVSVTGPTGSTGRLDAGAMAGAFLAAARRMDLVLEVSATALRVRSTSNAAGGSGSEPSRPFPVPLDVPDVFDLVFRHPAGDTEIARCAGCGAVADPAVMFTVRPAPTPEERLSVVEVATPDATTIASLAAFLGIDPDRTAKAAFFSADDGRLITAVVRGDHDVSEAKLAALVDATSLAPASTDAIRAAGMEPGYASPIGAHGTTVVVDTLAAGSPNLVAGANRAGFHLRNVNVGRDFTANLVADIAVARPGDGCPACGGTIEIGRAVPVVRMRTGVGSFDVDRAIACIVEAHHDERGPAWPAAVAPYAGHLVAIAANRDPAVRELADALHDRSVAEGCELLYDDRGVSPGVAFADADLIGLPVRLTVSPRSLAAGGVEMVSRASGERSVVPVEDALAALVVATLR